jgi:hypothetical protein
MKALTLWQPWASLVAAGRKSIETRGWSTRYRGNLLIHAAKESRRGSEDVLSLTGVSLPRPLPRGKVVAFAVLDDCREGFIPEDPLERHFGHYGPGRWAWILRGVIPLERPIPWAGAQGLWEVPPELFRLACDQVLGDLGEPEPATATVRQGTLF